MDDLISRQRLLKELKHHKELFCRNRIEFLGLSKNDKARADEIDNCYAMVINAPSAQPEQKTGRWVKHGTGHSIYYDCSLCGCVAPCTEVGDSFIWKLSTYCPDCGVKMGNDGKRLRTVEVKK